MYCVIMGDIVKSKNLDSISYDRLICAAKEAFARVNDKYKENIMASFGLVRGDAFEGVLYTQDNATQIVQDIIKAFYRADKTTIRICAVLGELTMTSSNRNETNGPAFHRALDILGEMKKSGNKNWMQVSFEIGAFGKSLVNSNLALLSALTERWTDRQREIVWATEENDGIRKTISKMFGIMPPVVSRHLKIAKYDIYRQAWNSLTEHFATVEDYITKQEGESL